MGSLNNFAFNVYSQNGEDGIIAELLRRLELVISKMWVVEFGAWDGKHLSNTFFLVTKNCNAVFIEGDEFKFKDLEITSSLYQNIIPINAFVSRDQSDRNSLDNILKKTDIPFDFELLSIDIDSYDLDVWESLNNYHPKIVVIEINSHILPGIVWRHSSKLSGNSFTATCNVGKEKGYTPVCHTGNLIFVRNDLINKLNLENREIIYPELLFLHDAPWLNFSGKI